jgi:ribonuclease HI
MTAGRKDMRVAELVDESTGTWNVELLHQMFNQRDVAEITTLLLNLLTQEDAPIWRYSKNGDYTVQSAYYQLMEHIIDNNNLKEPRNWKKLWSLHVPNKVKIFMWRLLRGCLPVRGRLTQRGVSYDNKCPNCASYEENEWHCFFGCVAVQEVWEESPMWNQIRPYIDNAIGIVQMLFHILEELDIKVLCQIIMTLWAVWWKRNQVCWQGKIPTTYEVNRRAREHYNEWIKARIVQQNNSSNSMAADSRVWTKPPSGMLKCNVDAACYNELNTYCITACVRDAQGRFVKAYTRWFEGKPEISEAEALGVLEALRWIQHEQMRDVQLETDCLQIIHALQSKSRNNTEFGIVINLCRSLLNLIPNCKVSHIRRQANRVAHSLAQATRLFASPQIFNHCPPCIETIIMNEIH